MPKQIVGVEVTDLGDGMVNIQIGPYGYQMDKSSLFDRSTFDAQQMKDNLRFAFKLAGEPDVSSQEYLTAVNGTNKGMELANDKYFIRSVKLIDNDNQIYEIGFGESRTGPIVYTIQMSRDEFQAPDTDDHGPILRNLKSFLRLEGASVITDAVKNKIRAHGFRY